MKKLAILLLALSPLTIQADVAQGVGEAVQGVGEGVENAASSTGEFVSDSAITTAVKSRIAAEMGDLTNISVSTIGGTVYLSGQVSTEEERNQISEIANGTTGVKNVDSSQIEIK